MASDSKMSCQPELLSTILLPKSLFKTTSGFSCDIGGSLAKFVYFLKETPELEENDTVTVHLTSFARPVLTEGLQYIKENFVKKADDKWRTRICTCGIGSFQFSDSLQEILGIKDQKNIQELDCFARGIITILKYIPSDEAVIEMDQEMRKKMKDSTLKTVKMMRGMIDKGETKMKYPTIEDVEKAFEHTQDGPVKFPIAVMMIGSGAATYIVNEDGSSQFLAMAHQAGRTLLGLGRLLTKAKTFQEIVEMAEKGKWKNVHSTTDDFQKDNTNTEDSYGAFLDEFKDVNELVFSYGKAVEKDLDEFRREDLASAVIYHLCVELVQIAALSVLKAGFKECYFCGSFVENDVIRHYISQAHMTLGMIDVDVAALRLRFIRNGGYLGALGALVPAPSSI